MGRKPLLSHQQVAHARTLLEQGERPDPVAQSLNVSRRTLYRTWRAAHLHRPHPSRMTDKGAVADLRDWLNTNGVEP
jgi:DNA invertase Pin-like site-specific DNA recombinase